MSKHHVGNDGTNHKKLTLTDTVLDDSTFDQVIDWDHNAKEKRGTHSLRKFAADRAAKMGILKDYIDLR